MTALKPSKTGPGAESNHRHWSENPRKNKRAFRDEVGGREPVASVREGK